MSVYEKLLELEKQLKDMKKEIKKEKEKKKMDKEFDITTHVLFPFYQGQLLCQPSAYKPNQNSKIWALSTMAMILVDFYDELIVEDFRPYFLQQHLPTEVRRFQTLAREEYGIIKDVPLCKGSHSKKVVLTEKGESLKKQLIQSFLFKGLEA